MLFDTWKDCDFSHGDMFATCGGATFGKGGSKDALRKTSKLLGGFPKEWWVFPPNHPFGHRVFHYFHHPFWGFPTILGNRLMTSNQVVRRKSTSEFHFFGAWIRWSHGPPNQPSLIHMSRVSKNPWKDSQRNKLSAKKIYIYIRL